MRANCRPRSALPSASYGRKAETQWHSFPYASLARAAKAVQHTSLDVLDYFRATMAVQHGQLLDSVPALGMQFANDCEWLAREVAELELEEDAEAALAFASLAKSTREAQLVRSAQ